MKHTHNDPRTDCRACIAWIKDPLPRVKMPFPMVAPAPQSSLEKRQAKLMQKIIDYEFAQIRGSKILRTPFGVLIWSPKKKGAV